MSGPYARKSTPAEIRARFDTDVERFSSLETGQQAAPDSPVCMELVAEAAAVSTASVRTTLDIGCGAGNYSVRMLQRRPGLDVTLLDLSRPMLDRAATRVREAGAASVEAVQGDVREVDLGEARFDVVLAAVVLHHLREEAEWAATFERIHRALRPGGSFWIVDLVEQAEPVVQAVMWRRYGEYLVDLRDEAYRDKVLAYIDREDTPRPLVWQLDLLRRTGFTGVDVLHKRLCVAAFGGRKPA